MLYASAGWLALLGCKPGDLEGRFWKDLVIPSDRNRAEEFLDRLLAFPRDRYREDLSMVGVGEVVRVLEMSGSVMAAAEAGPLVILSARDVTSQRDAEAELRARFERHQRMLEEDLTGSYVAAADGCLIECNPSFLDILGFSSFEEARGTNTLELYPDPRARTELLRSLATVKRLSHYEAELRRRDGVAIHVVENVVGDFDAQGDLVEIRVYLFDITPQMRLAREREELLAREKEARAQAESAERRAAFLAELGSLLDASLDYRTTLTNVARLIVPALADYCLIDEATEELGSRRVAIAHVDAEAEQLLSGTETNPGDADPARHPVVQVIRSGLPRFVPTTSDELLESISHGPEHLEKLKRLRVRGYIIVPLVARGRILGALTLVSSVSERRFTEHDVELAEAVARRSALAIDNARLYGRAQQAVRARDEVLAFVSHDLRNPLATILLNASALLDLVPEDRLSASQREQLEWIAHSSEQMNRLIHDLLDVSRVESGQFPLDPKPVKLTELIWEAVLFLQPLASEKGVSLEVEDEPTGVTGWMDRERVLRVLGNLVGNAIKFTPAGGEVKIGARVIDGELRFVVRDTGIGISPEDQERVFQGYWQRGAGGGSGLGLTIARGIVEAHGGRIWVRSVPGHGSTFHFTIPERPKEEG